MYENIMICHDRLLQSLFGHEHHFDQIDLYLPRHV